MVGANGGGAFMMVYITAILFIAMPLMLSEMLIGRRGRMSPPNSLRVLAKESGASTRWEGLGWIGLIGVFFGLSFFSVVGGWSLAYIFKSASGVFTGISPQEASQVFDAFQASTLEMVAWHLAFMAITVVVVSNGIRGGIETVAKWMMPALFFILFSFAVYGMFAGAFSQTIDFLFTFDLAKITPYIVLAAVGQALFSLNVGAGSVLTYAAYLPKDMNLPRAALIIALGDTCIALLAGFAIFPIVFSQGLDPEAGPKLIFVTLSAALGQIKGGLIIGTVFFILIFMAAVTSSIAMLETLVSRAEELPNSNRRSLSWVIGVIAFVVGLGTVFSFTIWQEVYPLGMLDTFADKTVFGLIDYLIINVTTPIGAIGFTVFAGWFLTREVTEGEIGFSKKWQYLVWRFLCRYVVPSAIVLIFLSNILA